MARTIAQITQTVYSSYITERAAAGLPFDDPANWSITSRKRLWAGIYATCAFLLESFFDIFKAEVETTIRNERSPSLIWQANKFKAYQHGFTLIGDSDAFDNTGHTDAEIAASKLVKYAVVVPVEDQFGRITLRAKVAGDGGNDLVQLDDAVVLGIKNYAQRFKPAGIKYSIQSLPADSLKLKARCEYNPIILDANGNRNDGTASDVVKNAIRQYLKDIGYQGVYNPEFHEDYVEGIEGVELFKIDKAEARYGLNAYGVIDIDYTPDAGWLRILNDVDLELTMIAKNVG